MWQKIQEILTTLLNISNEMQRNREYIRILREDLDDLTNIVRNIAADIRYSRQTDKTERENLVLQIENKILKLERQLPQPPRE